MDVDDEPKESRRSKAKSGPNGKADSSKLSVEEKPDSRIPDTESEQDEPEKSSRNGRKSTSAQEKKAETPAHIISEENVATFVEHRDMVSCVAWNPQNRLNLSTGSSDGTARLWDFDEKDEGSALSLLRQTPIPHKSIESSKKGVTALAWHPDGTFFATGKWSAITRLFQL
jgi:transducin (beta)-like 1